MFSVRVTEGEYEAVADYETFDEAMNAALAAPFGVAEIEDENGEVIMQVGFGISISNGNTEWF